MLLPDSLSLPSLVSRRFLAAKESGHLIFAPTQLATLRCRNGVEFQLRYCPALAKKPGQDRQSNQNNHSRSSEGQKKPDPFENPPAELVIADIPTPTTSTSASTSTSTTASHFLILNKFPVIANHFILATRSFEQQTDLLERADLEAAFACLKAWRAPPSSTKQGETGGRLFAFFNSGVESGASQPHRHLQFLPVEAMHSASSSSSGGTWRPLIDLLSSSTTTTSTEINHEDRQDRFEIRHLPTLPFQHFAIRLPQLDVDDSMDSNILHAMYLSLYRAALLAAGVRDTHELQRSSGPAAISYNLGMTEEVMMLCPRRKESGTLNIDLDHAADAPAAGEDDGMVSLNGTILAGTLMVKSEEQWDRIRGDAEVINSLLAEVGIPYT